MDLLDTLNLPQNGEILSQGAEALIVKTTFGSRPAILKQRFRKHYREKQLDERLSSSRVKEESRMMLRVMKEGGAAGGGGEGGRRVLECPAVYGVDVRQWKIYMEFISGSTLRATLISLHQQQKQQQQQQGGAAEKVTVEDNGNQTLPSSSSTANTSLNTQGNGKDPTQGE